MLTKPTFAFVFIVAVGLCACVGESKPAAPAAAAASPQPSAPTSVPAPPADVEAGLSVRLKEICDRAGGRCGVAVTHVEGGSGASSGGNVSLPLYSVFKLPLAVEVLKQVEEGRLQLDQRVHVEPGEVVPGVKENSDLWVKPSDRTVRELLEFSIVRSDNTSSDKLLELVGGPAAVTRRMKALGLLNIEVRAAVKEFIRSKEAHPNTGTATDLTRLLLRLQRDGALAPPQLEVLLGFMARAETGLRRLRAGTPAGTPIAEKTGSGPSTTNDVGLITLPGDRGHLALAVLLDGSKLKVEQQEDLIAEVARAAYDAYVAAK